MAPVVMVAVSVTPPASAAVGENTAVPLAYVTVPGIATPADVSVKVPEVSVVGSMASLNTALTFALRWTPAALSSGMVEVTVGTWLVEPPVPPELEPELEVVLEPEVETPLLMPVELDVVVDFPLLVELPLEVLLRLPVEPPVPVPLAGPQPVANAATRTTGRIFD